MWLPLERSHDSGSELLWSRHNPPRRLLYYARKEENYALARRYARRAPEPGRWNVLGLESSRGQHSRTSAAAAALETGSTNHSLASAWLEGGGGGKHFADGERIYKQERGKLRSVQDFAHRHCSSTLNVWQEASI